MSKTPLISVIIPIYNVAPYLRECLDSVINQSYANLQIILVNDGSTDESEDIAREYLHDSRVEFVAMDNGGLSMARNTGLDRARGEYICFIDSDDYIDLGFIEEMLEIAQTFDVDLVCNEQIVYFGAYSRCIRDRKEPQSLIPDSHNIDIGGSVWRCMFSQSLLERSGVRFLEGKIHEDEGFLWMIFPFCNRFVTYRGRPYYYRQRKNSIMEKNKDFRSYDLLDIFETIYLFYKEKGFLNRFQPPYYFLYECGLGYKNEREYLKKAEILKERLGLKISQPPLKARCLRYVKRCMKNLFCKRSR